MTGDAGDRSARRAAGASIFIVALLSALLFALSYPLPPVENDAEDYLLLARSVAAGSGFTKDGLAPEVYRPPLFSTMLGGWYFITGTSSPLSSAVFQSLEHAATAVVAFLLFLSLTPSLPWATGAALFLAVNPLLVTRVAFVLQEPTILLFTTVAAWCSVRFLGAPSGRRAAVAGAAWGFCTLAKIVSWYAPFLLVGIRLLPGGPRRERRGKEAVILLLCFAAVIAPWTIRNCIHFGRFIAVNDQGTGLLEWNVLQSNVPGERPGAEQVAEIRGRNLPPDEHRRMLWKYVLDHPAYFFGMRVLENALRFASPSRSWWWARGMYGPGEKRPWYWTVHDYLYRFLFLFLIYRFVQAVRGRCGAGGGFIAMYACVYWALYALAWGEGRFALPILPFLAAAPLPWGDSR